jgi:hypothetical protein
MGVRWLRQKTIARPAVDLPFDRDPQSVPEMKT